MDMFSWNTSNPISDEEQTPTLMLAEAHPKKRAGRKKFKETRHPIYRGPRLRSMGKWVCELREPNKKTRIWLGTYPTPEMAARAHDAAALILRGRSGACLNFADSAWLLSDEYLPCSSGSKDIQQAALRFAQAFPSGGPTANPSVQENVGPNEEDAGPSEATAAPEKGFNDCNYMDEDDIFEMPSLMADMYQGLMMSPPPQQQQQFQTCWSSSSGFDADVDFFDDVSLWNYPN